MIGEFAAKGPYAGIDPVKAYGLLHDNGYAGGMSWMYTGADGLGGINEAKPGMQAIAAADPVGVTVDADFHVGLIRPRNADPYRTGAPGIRVLATRMGILFVGERDAYGGDGRSRATFPAGSGAWSQHPTATSPAGSDPAN